jgi:hypothetical protein
VHQRAFVFNNQNIHGRGIWNLQCEDTMHSLWKKQM